jgi:hypothetical protein
MQIVPIVSKGRTFRGHKYPDQETGVVAHIVRNESIRMVGNYSNRAVDKTFKIGDKCEYDSYNLSYHGTIVKITDKGVTVRPDYETRTKRLPLNTFMWRNHDFDLERSQAANHETSMYI